MEVILKRERFEAPIPSISIHVIEMGFLLDLVGVVAIISSCIRGVSAYTPSSVMGALFAMTSNCV